MVMHYCTALSVGLRVEMSCTCPDAQPMAGIQVTFSLTGEGREAYKLMVVTPGLHVFAGYGTDDASPVPQGISFA